MTMPPGYDAWKTSNPDDPTPEQEREAEARAREQEEDLREAIAAALHDNRGDIYLADIRRIVIEELNKLKPGPGEPSWQTRTPVPIPRMG